MTDGTNSPELPLAVILAGGRSRRMGEEKSLLVLETQTLLARVIERLAPQVSSMIINANGDLSRFASFDLPVVADTMSGYKGPLAGILAGMVHAREHHPECSHIVTIACDTPFFPTDLVARLLASAAEQAREGALDGALMIAVPRSKAPAGREQRGNRQWTELCRRLHPAFGLYPVSLADDLEHFLGQGHRRVHGWLARRAFTAVDFPLLAKGCERMDPFFNINRKADLVSARNWLKEEILRKG